MLDPDLVRPDLCLLDPARLRGVDIDLHIDFCKDLEPLLGNVSRNSIQK